MHKLTVCDGKYTFVCNEHFGVEEVLRYNEEWTSNVNPLNAVSALCSELYEAWAERDALKQRVEELDGVLQWIIKELDAVSSNANLAPGMRNWATAKWLVVSAHSLLPQTVEGK